MYPPPICHIFSFLSPPDHDGRHGVKQYHSGEKRRPTKPFYPLRSPSFRSQRPLPVQQQCSQECSITACVIQVHSTKDAKDFALILPYSDHILERNFLTKMLSGNVQTIFSHSDRKGAHQAILSTRTALFRYQRHLCAQQQRWTLLFPFYTFMKPQNRQNDHIERCFIPTHHVVMYKLSLATAIKKESAKPFYAPRTALSRCQRLLCTRLCAQQQRWMLLFPFYRFMKPQNRQNDNVERCFILTQHVVMYTLSLAPQGKFLANSRWEHCWKRQHRD